MLKAKLKSKTNKRKSEAMREVSKIDNEKAVYARVTAKEMKKLRVYLVGEEMTLAEWVKEKIADI